LAGGVCVRMNAKEIFGFLKPRQLNVSLALIVTFIFSAILLWNYIIPMAGSTGGDILFINVGANLTPESRNIVTGFILILITAVLIISYALISLIVYFVKGRHRDE